MDTALGFQLRTGDVFSADQIYIANHTRNAIVQYTTCGGRTLITVVDAPEPAPEPSFYDGDLWW